MATIAARVVLAVILLSAGFLFLKTQEYKGLTLQYEELFDQNSYDEAAEVVQKQMRLTEGMFFLKRFFMPACFNNLGSIYYARNDMVRAEVYFGNAAQSAEEAFGKKSAKLIPLYENLVMLYETTGDHDKRRVFTEKIAGLKAGLR